MEYEMEDKFARDILSMIGSDLEARVSAIIWAYGNTRARMARERCAKKLEEDAAAFDRGHDSMGNGGCGTSVAHSLRVAAKEIRKGTEVWQSSEKS